MEEKAKTEIERRTRCIAAKFKAKIMDMSFAEIEADIEWILEDYRNFN